MLRFRTILLLLCLVSAAPVHAQSNTAVVTGAERVRIRRGPGVEFSPFATIAAGSTVDVQAMEGEWARIVTAAGQVGYVSSTFLALPGERPAAPAAEPQPVALRTSSEQNKALTAEIRRLQDELAALKDRAAADAPPAPPPARMDAEKVLAELAHLTAAVENLQRQIEVRPHSEAAAPPAGTTGESPRAFSSSRIVLAITALLIGWAMGSAYGRKHERGQRSRVRL